MKEEEKQHGIFRRKEREKEIVNQRRGLAERVKRFRRYPIIQIESLLLASSRARLENEGGPSKIMHSPIREIRNNRGKLGEQCGGKISDKTEYSQNKLFKV